MTVRAGGVTRRRVRFGLDAIRAIRALERRMPGDAVVRPTATPNNKVAVNVRRQWATIDGHANDEDAAELSGELFGAGLARNPGLKLRMVGPGTSRKLGAPLDVQGERFTAEVPVADLSAQAGADRHDEATVWDLYVAGEGRRHRVSVAPDLAEARWSAGDRELALVRDQQGDASLVMRPPHAVVTEARWTEGGELEMRGDFAGHRPPYELVLFSRYRLEQHVFPLASDSDSGRFEARVSPARIATLAGELPLREGTWGMYVRAVGGSELVPVILAQACYDSLPLRTFVGHKTFALGMSPEQQATLVAHRDLDDDERGGFHQRRLREAVYAPRRAEPLRDAVVYSSFDGRQYSCNPRAVHEELLRRQAPLEHLWVVRDGMCEVPSSASVLRMGSREHYEALARSRFVVANDHLPEWFERRPDQICVQTWHGTPLKRLGLDLLEVRPGISRAAQRWSRQAENWQYLVSPNHYSTAILQRAYSVTGEVLETGYPRDDALAGGDRDRATRRVRDRLGLSPDTRVVLYAPTFRDHVRDSRGRYRLNLQLDLERLRGAIGQDTVLLIRKHHRVAEVIPQTNGFVRDVSTYPDGTELLLAADVLVTDYSSMMFDFANTGRPMLFFTYDLDAYRDQVRGLYLDLATRPPGRCCAPPTSWPRP